jgi:hypothetical protein
MQQYSPLEQTVFTKEEFLMLQEQFFQNPKEQGIITRYQNAMDKIFNECYNQILSPLLRKIAEPGFHVEIDKGIEVIAKPIIIVNYFPTMKRVQERIEKVEEELNSISQRRKAVNNNLTTFLEEYKGIEIKTRYSR